MVVELRFDTGSAPLGHLNRHQSHLRQRSDELIEDLELQLGTSQFPYMDIRVLYSHSAFPAQDCLEAVAGVVSVHSRMTTTAVASLKRQNDRSPWSPRLDSTPNILFPLIEAHWGVEKAQEAMRQMLAQRSTTRRPARPVSIMSLDRKARSSYSATEYNIHDSIIPYRRSSLDYQERIDKLPIERKESPSIGNMTLSTRSTEYATSEDSDSPSRKRRSLGSDSIRALLPRAIDAATDDRNGRIGRPGRVWGTTKLGPSRNGGRWAWASWF
jgi:hypothetical protein